MHRVFLEYHEISKGPSIYFELLRVSNHGRWTTFTLIKCYLFCTHTHPLLLLCTVNFGKHFNNNLMTIFGVQATRYWKKAFFKQRVLSTYLNMTLITSHFNHSELFVWNSDVLSNKFNRNCSKAREHYTYHLTSGDQTTIGHVRDVYSLCLMNSRWAQ